MGQAHPLTTFRENQSPPLSQGQLAVLLGVDKTTVWRWEKGQRRVDEELLSRVSERTGIAPADLRPDLAKVLEYPEAAQ